MTRKRNDRCRNKICACTGECYIDDGTGDFAKPIDPRIGLERLRSRMLGWEDCDHEINQLKALVIDVLELKGGWREAITELEDFCSEPVRLKNMMAAADQIDDWSKRAKKLLNEIEDGGSK